MIVFFIQVQISSNFYSMNIINDYSNLGRIFVDFIKFYGLKFYTAKCVIVLPSPNGEQPEQETINFFVRILFYF